MLAESPLLETLRCPVNRSPLRMLDSDELRRLNDAIGRGHVMYADGARVTEPLKGGLATSDGASSYRIQDGIPYLLPDLRIVRAGGKPQSFAPPQSPEDARLWSTRWGQVSQFWDHIQPPIRPVPQDIRVLESLAAEAAARAGDATPRALLLGVTPEIAAMRWPAGTQLLAADSCLPMIRKVWPANAVAGAVVTLADWFALPVCNAAFDVVVGDGSVNTLDYPDGIAAFARETRRVLKNDGVLAIRAFCRPANPETVDAIFEDLFGRRIGNIDVFNWRLAMALHRGLAAGTRFGDLWEVWHPRVPDSAGLMRSLGWPPEAPVEFIEAMRGFDGRMVFPTVAELSESLAGEFRQTACHFPDYETGDRYPTFVFEPNPRAGGRG